MSPLFFYFLVSEEFFLAAKMSHLPLFAAYYFISFIFLRKLFSNIISNTTFLSHFVFLINFCVVSFIITIFIFVANMSSYLFYRSNWRISFSLFIMINSLILINTNRSIYGNKYGRWSIKKSKNWYFLGNFPIWMRHEFSSVYKSGFKFE